MPTEEPFAKNPAQKEQFATTQWSVVLTAGDLRRQGARDALTQLCQSYWYPVYAFTRWHVRNVHEAQDLTQGFSLT